MKEFLQKLQSMTALTAAAMLILGILLMVNPMGAILTVCRIVGCILLLAGAALVFMFLIKRGWETGSPWDIAVCVLGAVLLAVGIFVILRPGSIVEFVNLLFAVVLFLHGIYDFREMLKLKRLRDDKWWVSLILTAITFVMGFLLLASPFMASVFVTMAAGAFLLFDGAVALFLAFRVQQVGRRNREDETRLRDDIIDGEAEDIDE